MCWDFPRSYGRGAGYLMTCASNLQYDAGLCYPYCSSGYAGVGPVCWGYCPSGYSECGGALCLTDSSACSSTIANMVKSGLDVVLGIVSGEVIDAVEGALSLGESLVFAVCH